MQAQLDRVDQALRQARARYGAVLAERDVVLLLGAGFASDVGDWFNTVALISLSFHFGDGALGVGGMLAVRMVTRLLAQGPAGALVDRTPGRPLLITSQLLMAVIAAAFAVLVIVPELWLLFLLVFLLESVNCVARPAFMVELKAVAPEHLRAAANGALFASTTTAQLVGPLLGALALAPFGAGMVFVLNGVTFLAVAAAVAQVRGGSRGTASAAVDAGTSRHQPAAPVQPATSGYAWLLRRQDLGLYALGCLSLSLLTQAAIALFVVRANTLGLGDGGVGVFFAAVALGSIAGSLIAGGRAAHASPLYPAAVAMGCCALALATFGVAGTAVLALAALVAVGFTTDFYEVVGITHFQHSIPDDAYGRFFSLFLIALSAGGLVGALAGPALERVFGVAPSLAALAAPGVTLALLLAFLSRNWGEMEPARVAGK